MAHPETATIPERDLPRWPLRLQEVCRELQSSRRHPARDELIGEAWLLIKTALYRYLRYHSSRLGPIAAEDLDDIASEKAFDLLRKIELEEWDLSGRRSAEIQSYLSHVARNGLINMLKKARRHLQEGLQGRSDSDAEKLDRFAPYGEERPDIELERKEFVEELKRCVERLNGPAQRVWFLRVFCEMKSKEIARHPGVGLNPGHVDVIMQRSHRIVKECMQSKGFNPGDIRPGTFTALWQSVLLDSY